MLPNLRVEEELVGTKSAVAGMTSPIAQDVLAARPSVRAFLGRFSGQFGETLAPSVILRRCDIPDSYKTYDALAGLRDILSACSVPLARACYLAYGAERSPGELHFSDVFDIYPWMPGGTREYLHLRNYQMNAVHVVSQFHGQGTPGVRPGQLMDSHFEKRLAETLLERWDDHFGATRPDRADTSLFRALNMAREAARMPSGQTVYDVGRNIALWVSAYEILAHMGKRSSLNAVLALLEHVSWQDSNLREDQTIICGTAPARIPTWLCRKIYALRNDFLHGNDVSSGMLSHNGRGMLDYAACLFRFVLAGFLKEAPAGPIGDVFTEGSSTYWLERTGDLAAKQWWNLERGLLTLHKVHP
ncbi:hypothetical protein [Azorhizobium caulinodans]|uniref:hypothetical protein n=1 Tax=Azorhizobium caulinodans TaxID=7 RepID=UPI002FBEA5D9